MLSPEALLLFIPTITLLVILPGPDFAVVSKISIMDGRRQGQLAALGVALGICLHTVLAMLGISAILARSAMLFSILKYAGALYLLWLGINSIWQSFHTRTGSERVGMPSAKRTAMTHVKAFQTGFLTNALNPKAILYFMVLYPQFLNSSAPVFFQFLEMGMITAFICIVWYVSLAWILGRIGLLLASDAFQRWLLRVSGGIFMFFGLKLACQDFE